MLVQAKVIFVSVAHRYWHTLWSPEENRKAYGTLASVQGVGSNLKITLSCQVEADREPPWDVILNYLRERLDHRCLFTDEDVFRIRPSTLENIVLWLGSELAIISPVDGGRWVGLEVCETDSIGCQLSWPDRLVLKQKVGNLWLTLTGRVDQESGLMISREAASQAVARLFPRFAASIEDEEFWLSQLFHEFQKELPALVELTVDLGCQKSLRIALP
jgi:hypothetical protein